MPQHLRQGGSPRPLTPPSRRSLVSIPGSPSGQTGHQAPPAHTCPLVPVDPWVSPAHARPPSILVNPWKPPANAHPLHPMDLWKPLAHSHPLHPMDPLEPPGHSRSLPSPCTPGLPCPHPSPPSPWTPGLSLPTLIPSVPVDPQTTPAHTRPLMRVASRRAARLSLLVPCPGWHAASLPTGPGW